MNDTLISFETAKLAKEKGFDLGVAYFFDEETKELDHDLKEISKGWDCRNFNNMEGFISTPTQALLQKWLREKFNIDLHISSWDTGTWHYTIKKVHGDIYSLGYTNRGSFDSYEEALEIGLQSALKLVKEC